MVEMERIEKILSDPQYRFYCEKNQKWEQSRVFCKHDMEHFWQTARVAYILYLESKDEDDKLSGGKVKEMLYAAALLHDIGRFKEYEDETLDMPPKAQFWPALCSTRRAFALRRLPKFLRRSKITGNRDTPAFLG